MPLSKLTPAEQNIFLKSVLDSTSEGFYSVDMHGATTLCNAAFLRMLGYDSAEEVIGRKIHAVIHHSQPDGSEYRLCDCPIYIAANTGASAHVPNEVFFRKDGSSFPVEYRAEPIYLNGKLQGAVCTFTDISKRLKRNDKVKRLEAEAQDALERLELALKSGAVLGTWIWDIPNNRVVGDERFARTFSLDPKDMANGVPIELVTQSIHPEDVPRVNALIAEALAKGGAYRAEYRVRLPEDKWLWVEASGRVEMDTAGKPLRFPGILIDIDERKHVENSLYQTNEQLRIAQSAGGIGVFSVDIASNIMHVTPEFCRIFGLPETECNLVATEVESYCLAADGNLVSNTETRTAGTAPLAAEYRIVRKNDGQMRWIMRRAEFMRDAAGKPTQMIGVVQDITERKRVEVNLYESKAHLSLMVESAQDYAIISIDPSGHIISWNTGAEHIFGYLPEQMIGQHIEMIFTPEDRRYGTPQLELATAAKNGRANDERWHIRANGERFYVSGIMAAMYEEGSLNVKGFIKIARDMTAQKHAQEELMEARNAAEAANIAKTEFLANMSHEIRTPMNAVIGLANILAMSQPLTQKQQEFIRTLQMSADSLLALINDLLDIAKIEARTVSLEHIPFSVTQIVQEVVSMMAVRVKEKGLSFTGDGDCVEHRMFIGDPTRLRQIITNLCSNAVKFTDQGNVHVSIACHPTDRNGVEDICISVTDSGIGIAPDKLDTIFHKFVQADTSINRKYGGTGLGLAITKTLTEIMGGTISVQSTPGKGSVFEVRIPLEVAEDMDVAASNESLACIIDTAISSKTKTRVLLVEDYAPNVMVATTFLEHFGYAVDVASNGLEAFEMTGKNAYAVALMDVQMHGMNGFESTKLIREREEKESLPRLPIIGMTAHAMAGDRERCIAAGMDNYIPKPFNPAELDQLLKNYCQKP